MKHEDLFFEYQSKLNGINRRLEPDALVFYKDSAESGKYAKEVTFGMYQSLRYFCEDGIPKWSDCFIKDNLKQSTVLPVKYDNGYECPCCGFLQYRDLEFPVYYDDYGMTMFIVFNGIEIQVNSSTSPIDWYYKLDRILDNID